jgi:hypothetical protein
MASSSGTGSGEVAARSSRRRSSRLAFAVLAAVCVAVAIGYVSWTVVRDSSTQPGATAERAGASLAGSAAQNDTRVLFQHVARDADYARIAVAPVAGQAGSRDILPLTCERVHFAADRGICLMPKRGILGHKYQARIFDSTFKVRHEPSLPGINSRARVSPDGRYGATTGFVTGDSYADDNFSTRTFIIDLRNGEVLGNLEDFEVWRDGEQIRSIDFNFWGVTFARDSNRFYATLATRGTAYLVEGNVEERRVTVLHEDVECPSLSPDNTRVAYKKPVENGVWRLHVLDLDTMKETTLAETRSVDDQVEWLDNERVLYAVEADVWSARADGSGTPRKFLSEALSPAVIS